MTVEKRPRVPGIGPPYGSRLRGLPRPSLLGWVGQFPFGQGAFEAAPRHVAVGQQQQRLVRRRDEARLGVRRVYAALEPAGVRARLQADELRAVAVAEQ